MLSHLLGVSSVTGLQPFSDFHDLDTSAEYGSVIGSEVHEMSSPGWTEVVHFGQKAHKGCAFSGQRLRGDVASKRLIPGAVNLACTHVHEVWFWQHSPSPFDALHSPSHPTPQLCPRGDLSAFVLFRLHLILLFPLLPKTTSSVSALPL